MSKIGKLFRMKAIDKMAKYVATQMGDCDSNCWVYDDKKMRVEAQHEATVIYYTGEKRKREKVFNFCTSRSEETVFCEGQWEYYLRTCYSTAKTRPK